MTHSKRILFNFILGTVTCLSLLGLSTPSFAQAVSNWISPATANLTAEVRQAETVLLAQGMGTSSFKRYAATLSKGAVVGASPSGRATGFAGAVLSGDRLVVRGDFRNLTSPLRDYTVDPVDPPNPNITSGVHIHRGEPTANGPFQYALTVTLGDAGNGRFAGEYTLTPEQLQALDSGNLYFDIHTTRNRAGELRGVLRSY
ncbi:MAG: hypothetical protein Fur0046_24860 [Cyanobacteria bacterium J069]